MRSPPFYVCRIDSCGSLQPGRSLSPRLTCWSQQSLSQPANFPTSSDDHVFEVVTSVFQSTSILTATAVTSSSEERQTLFLGHHGGQACRSHCGGAGAALRAPASHALPIHLPGLCLLMGCVIQDCRATLCNAPLPVTVIELTSVTWELQLENICQPL